MPNENSLPFDPGKVPDLIKQGKIKVVSTPNPPTHEAPGRIHETLEFAKAKEIMGDEFFGPDDVENALGYELNREHIPEIPFSAKELEEAKAKGQFLMYYDSKTKDGKDITMSRLYNDQTPRIEAHGEGKVLYDTDWYKNEQFFTTDTTPTSQWKLTTKDVIPGSTSHNYLEQTQDIVDYVNTLSGMGPLPLVYQEAMNEFYGQKPLIEGILSSNWKEAAKKLAQLQINQMFRQTPVEALYAELVYFQTNGDKRLLEITYTWTNRQASDDGLVYVGRTGTGGVCVRYWRPGYSNGAIGVVLSR